MDSPDSQRPSVRRLRPHVLLLLADRGRIEKLNIAAADLNEKSKFDVFGNLVSRLPEIERMVFNEKTMKRSVSRYDADVSRRQAYYLSRMFKMNRHTASLASGIEKINAMKEAFSASDFLTDQGSILWMFHVRQTRELRDRWFSDDLYFWATAAYWAPVALYGAINIAAWNAHFPSSVERVLWLVASFVITSVASQFVYRFGSATIKELVPSPFGPPVRFTHLAGYLAIGAHVPITIASWISLRSLPASAFRTVDWVMTFPHVS